MKTQAIIQTAGIGERFKAELPKELVELWGKPLWVYGLEVSEKSRVIDSIILVGHKERLAELENIVNRYGLKKVTKVVTGGETRRESVSCGLAALDGDTDIVLVHDGVRPLVSPEVVEGAVALCGQWDAVVAAVPVKSTIKKVDTENLFVEETLDRDKLWEIQTPQVFKKDVLIKVHKDSKDDNPSDDAVMAEQLGIKVKIFPGDYANIKVTTQEDLLVAETFLQSNRFFD